MQEQGSACGCRGSPPALRGCIPALMLPIYPAIWPALLSLAGTCKLERGAQCERPTLACRRFSSP